MVALLAHQRIQHPGRRSIKRQYSCRFLANGCATIKLTIGIMYTNLIGTVDALWLT
jgi:hypothetical protein